MRAETLRTYKTVHTWTGIIAGLALFVAFYAGALTMFKVPLSQWSTPRVAASPAGWATADALVARTLQVREDARADFTLQLGDDRRPHRITWKTREAPQGWSATLGFGDVLLVEAQRAPDLAGFIDTVHRTAGLPVGLELGTTIMALVSALYMIAIVSGVVVLWPTLVKDFFAFRVGRNLKRMWLDAHNVVGIVSLPFHVVMALSAVIFGMHDYIYDAQKVAVYGDRFDAMWRASGPFASVRPDVTPAPSLPLERLAERVKAQVPGFEPHTLRMRGAGTVGGVAWITGNQPCCMPRSPEGGMVLVDTVNGNVRHTEYLAGHQSSWMASVSVFFSLHFGNYGGQPVRWGYFLLGIAGAFLFYSGNLLWIESRRKAQRSAASGPVVQSRSTRWMAAATVGVCLGCVCALSFTIAASKWLQGLGGDAAAGYRLVYGAVFLGCLLWAFARGGARAAVELLWLAAIAAWSIPLTTLLGALWPVLGPWAPASSTQLGVDLVALIGGVGFLLMACAARRRIRNGRKDSVWAGSI